MACSLFAGLLRTGISSIAVWISLGRQRSRTDDLRYSFCGKRQAQVAKLVFGDHGAVCDDCIRVANGILEDEGIPTGRACLRSPSAVRPCSRRVLHRAGLLLSDNMVDLEKAAGWLKEHPAIPLAVVPSVLALVKVAAASRFVLTSQLTIASKSDPIAILTGTLITLVPAAAMLVMIGSVLAFRSSESLAKNFGFLGIVLSGFVLAYIPLVNRLLPAAAALGAVSVAVQILFHKRSLAEKSTITAGLVLLVATATTGVWLPAEAIERRTDDTLVGFVLDDNVDPMPVLVNQSRVVLLVPRSDIDRRYPCRTRALSRSLADVVLRRDQAANLVEVCPGTGSNPLP